MMTVKKFLVNTLAVLFLGLLFVLGTSQAQADSWADQYQLFDDTFNDLSAYSLTVTSPGAMNNSSILNGNANVSETSGGSGSVISKFGPTAPTTFVWNTQIILQSIPPSPGYIGMAWHYTSTSSEDFFYCNTTSCYISENGTNKVTLGSAPAACNSSPGCPIKIVSINNTATVFTGSISGNSVTWTQLGNGVALGDTGGNFAYEANSGGATGKGAMNIYSTASLRSCVNHISSNPDFDCTTWRDVSYEVVDDIFSNSIYTLHGYGTYSDPVSGNRLVPQSGASSLADVWFAPFTSFGPWNNMVWIIRSNGDNFTGTAGLILFATSEYAPPNGGSACASYCLQFEYGIGANSNNFVLREVNGSTVDSTINTTLPGSFVGYFKFIYNNGSLSIYDSTAKFPTSWTQVLAPTVIPSKYIAGPYFGFFAVNDAIGIGSDGSGTSFPCINNFSTNPGWDCFTQAIFSTPVKQVRFPSAIVYDSLNDTSKFHMTSAGTTVTVSPVGFIESSNGAYGYEANTGAWNNQAVFARVNGAFLTLRAASGTQVGYTAWGSTSNSQICVAYNNGSSYVNQVCNNTIVPLTSSFYIYAYSNASNSVSADIFNEASPGVVGQLVGTASTTSTSVASGYMGLHLTGNTSIGVGGSQSGGQGFPVIMYNYGSNNAPSFPPFGGTFNPVEFFWDGFTNVSNETLNNSTANACTTATTPTVANGAITVANGTCVIANGTSNYQNVAVVARVNIPGAAWASYNPRVWGRINAAASSGIYVTPDGSGHICVNAYNLGYGSNACSTAAVATSSTAWYDEFMAVSNVGEAANYYNVWGQLCPELSTGSPDFNNCVSIYNNRNINGTTTLMSVGIEPELSNTTYGGAYPYFQARDYGDGQPPTTLSQFLRGSGF